MDCGRDKDLNTQLIAEVDIRWTSSASQMVVFDFFIAFPISIGPPALM